MVRLLILFLVLSISFPACTQKKSQNEAGCGRFEENAAVPVAACAYEPFPPAPEVNGRPLKESLTIYPKGARIPKSFLDQVKKGDLGGHSACVTPWKGGAECDAYVLDIYGAGATAVLMAAPADWNDHYLAMEIFRQKPDGEWAKSGELVVTCAASIQALRRGELTFAPPKVRDIVVGGRQFSVLPETDYGCPELGGNRPTAPN